jgi:hypothetical protein
MRMRQQALHCKRTRTWRTLATGLVLALAASGCASQHWVSVRRTPENPLSTQLALLARGGPHPSERTMLLLRQYDLADKLTEDPCQLVAELREIFNREPTADKLYSLAELAYISGRKTELTHSHKALELYGATVLHSYMYLFDDRFAGLRNPYDPEFRGACDLYNSALESALRIVKKDGGLKPGMTHQIKAASHKMNMTIVLRGEGWQSDDIDHFEFVSDYAITGLKNQYHTYGLGVPLIAVRRNQERQNPIERYYPPGTSLPVTAFVRMLPDTSGKETEHEVVLELYDPLSASDIMIGSRRVPLETDLSTPLAYMLNQPQLKNLDQSTLGLLDPDATKKAVGLYMLEPYQAGKIPVLMVHGIWSSPVTWMEMFNDLRSLPDIRDKFQFWFYLYPTGQPFWYSAAQLRDDLAALRGMIDPGRREPALDQMVLVGHSMGGLVAKLQTLDSGNEFWQVVSKEPFQLVKASPDVKHTLEETFFFKPNTGVRRLITIGTPFRGSDAANGTTAWVGRKLITLPKAVVTGGEQLHRDNPGYFADHNLIDVPTSIDSLSPKSPIFPVMLASNHLPSVKYHNIVGRIPKQGLIGHVAGDSDGIVAYSSAHLEDVASEIIVPAEHMNLHRHPRSVLEVRRILLEHLEELSTFPQSLERLPYTTGIPNGATIGDAAASGAVSTEAGTIGTAASRREPAWQR